jgi:hypothetical protein
MEGLDHFMVDILFLLSLFRERIGNASDSGVELMEMRVIGAKDR